MTEQERAAARRWLEWADDTGKQVIRAAELRAQGFGEVDMRTLLHMAFQAGAHAQWVADLRRARVRAGVAEVQLEVECEWLRKTAQDAAVTAAKLKDECERLRAIERRLVVHVPYRAGGLQDDLDAAGKDL